MIDPRFQLVTTERKDLFHLLFRVDIPLDKNYKKSDTEAVIAVCKQQYPELVFSCADDFYTYNARFPDGQYASGITETTQSAHTNLGYVKSILFSLPLNLDSIMAGVCSFKKAVPSIEYAVDPVDLIDMPPEVFYECVENLYSVRHKISLRIKAVSWRFLHMDGDNPVYSITPTDYEYI